MTDHPKEAVEAVAQAMRGTPLTGSFGWNAVGDEVRDQWRLRAAALLDQIAPLLTARAEADKAAAGRDAVEFIYKHGDLTYSAANAAIRLLTQNGFQIVRECGKP